ncbi:MAG: sodium-independent anion transporter [Desulfobacterales bacterium]|nr:MAG: sodium-independent anion transporter [Desulfobacterales bacterium]
MLQLFFGSADNLAREIESAMNQCTYCIVDMKRVNEIDSTGAKILGQISKKVNESGKYLLISHLSDDPSLSDFLKAMGVYEILDENCFFPDTDAALEWAEDNVLTQSIELAGISGEIQFEQMDILKDETSEIAVKLIRNNALEMSNRLRKGTNEVRVLEEG